jgi:N utilization substance protein B
MKVTRKRDASRNLAFTALFIHDVAAIPAQELAGMNWYARMADFDTEDDMLLEIEAADKPEIYQEAADLLNGTISQLARVDDVIREHLVKWDFTRLRAVDKAVLRLSVYCLLYRMDIPSEVIIAEANDLADSYGDDHAASYINGMLHHVKEKYRGNPITGASAEDQPAGKQAGAVKPKIKLKKREG